MNSTKYPTAFTQGPFTAKVQVGGKKYIQLISLKTFNLADQAVQWCEQARAKLRLHYPKRRWIGYVYNSRGHLHQLAFQPNH